MEITQLPFNQLIGLEREVDPRAALTLPRHPKYTNHLGTVHASALVALAEAASGEFLLRSYAAEAAGSIPVVRRLEAKFRKAAYGAVTAQASVPSRASESFVQTLSAKGRAFVTVVVEVHDESGAHALSATVEWFVSRSPAAAGESA